MSQTVTASLSLDIFQLTRLEVLRLKAIWFSNKVRWHLSRLLRTYPPRLPLTAAEYMAWEKNPIPRMYLCQSPHHAPRRYMVVVETMQPENRSKWCGNR